MIPEFQYKGFEPDDHVIAEAAGKRPRPTAIAKSKSIHSDFSFCSFEAVAAYTEKKCKLDLGLCQVVVSK